MKRKFFSIGLVIAFSILLWTFVSFSGSFSITLNLPVEIVDVPEGFAISYLSTNEVTVNLKGEGWQLAKQTFGRNPKFYIPSPDKIGLHAIPTIKMMNRNQWLSTVLQLDKITPEKIQIRLEKKLTKQVKILPDVKLEFAPDYNLVSEISVQPDSVTVSGPISIVKEIKNIRTVHKKFKGLEKHTTVKIKLQKQPFLKYNIDECNLNFDVQKIVDKAFQNIKVGVTGVPPRYKIILSPNRITVSLRGGIRLLSKMKNEDIVAYLKFSQLINDTTGAIEPEIKIPNYTTIIDKVPQKIEYIIKKY